MPLQNCQQHHQLAYIICGQGSCKEIICPQCFNIHALQFQHYIGVKLNQLARHFFIKWSQLLIDKLKDVKRKVQIKGYTQFFELKVESRYPIGTLPEIIDIEITDIAIQIIEDHLKIAKGNLCFVEKNVLCENLNHSEFIKDLYGLIIDDTTINLSVFCRNLQAQLVEKYPHKQIYQFCKFNLIRQEMKVIEQERKKLYLQVHEDVIFKKKHPNKSRIRTTDSPSPLSKKQRIKSSISPKNYFQTDPKMSSPTNKYFKNNDKVENINKNQNEQDRKSEKKLIQSQMSLQQSKFEEINLLQSKKCKNSDLQTTYNRQKKMQHQIRQLTQQLIQIKEDNRKINIKMNNLIQQNRLKKQQQVSISKIAIEIERLENQNLKYRKKEIAVNEEQTKQKNIIIKLNDSIAKILLKTDKTSMIKKEYNCQLQELEIGIKQILDRVNLAEKSIRELNLLIGNEEEELSYRENQCQTLTKEIKRLMNRIVFLEKSIHELNNLIGNQEEELSYRQNECERLTVEIKKLLMKIQQLERSIKQLNNLIGNQEEQIGYREGQVQNLKKDIKKLLDRIKQLQRYKNNNNINNNNIENIQHQFNYNSQNNNILQKENNQLNNQKQILQNQINNLKYNNLNLQNQIHNLKQQMNNKILKKQIHINSIQQINQKLQKCLSSISDILKIKKDNYSDWQALNKQICNILIQNIEKVDKFKIVQSINLIMLEENSVLKKQKDELGKKLEGIDSNNINDELLDQSIELQAQVENKNRDLNLLIKILNDLMANIQLNKANHIKQQLVELKTVKLQ